MARKKKKRRRRSRPDVPAGNRLSLCVIARDEEEFIGRCLGSVASVAAEMIVVDTGSTDATGDVARAGGATLLSFEWCDDFAAAKNYALDHATGDWILFLDADEMIARRDLGKLTDLLRSRSCDAYNMPIRTYQPAANLTKWFPNPGDYDEGDGFSGFTLTHLARLFRRDPQVRYVGRMHELIEPALERAGKRILPTDVTIHHYGHYRSEDRLRRKAHIYRELGARKVEDDPTDAKSHYDLGTQCVLMKDLAVAERAFKRAIELEPEHARAHFGLGNVYLELERLAEAEDALQQAVRLQSDHVSAYANLGVVYFRQKNYAAAIAMSQAALSLNPTHATACSNLAAAHEAMHHTAEALSAYARLLELDPAHFPLVRERVEAMQSRLGHSAPTVRHVEVDSQADAAAISPAGAAQEDRREHPD